MPDSGVSAVQRLAGYAAERPDLIDAVRLTPVDDIEWWSAPVKGSRRRLVWNDRGDVFLASRMDARIRQVAVGTLPFIATASLLTPMAPFWGVPAGLFVGSGVSVFVRRRWPHWTRFGHRIDPAAAQRTLEEFVARYEADVPPADPGGSP